VKEPTQMTAWEAIGEPDYFDCPLQLVGGRVIYELIGTSKEHQTVIVGRVVQTVDGFKHVKRYLRHDQRVILHPADDDPNRHEAQS